MAVNTAGCRRWEGLTTSWRRWRSVCGQVQAGMRGAMQLGFMLETRAYRAAS